MNACQRMLPAVCLIVVAATLTGCVSDIYEVRVEKPVFLETTRQEKVLVDVRNSSGVVPFPLQESIIVGLKAKGYTILDTTQAQAADVELRMLVQYVGLEKPEFKGDRAFAGGLIGAGVGAIGAAAGNSSGSGVAIGALAGAALGAGLGALQEKQASKEIFTGLVVLRIKEKGKRHETKIYCRVREKDLTYQKAIGRVAESIAAQVVGLF